MNKLKKIGLTALSASLVSISANAAEMSVNGNASMSSELYSGTQMNYGKGVSMGNQLTFSASGSTEGGLDVGLTFILDQSDADPSPFDNHSVSVGNDTFGTLVLHGEGGSTASGAYDTTAAGDLWDAFDDLNFGPNATAGGVDVLTAAAGDNMLYYTAPTVLEDLTVNVSYVPQGAGATATETSMGFALTYAGIPGLTATYATSDINTNAAATEGDHEVIRLNYAFEMLPLTVGYSVNEHDVGAAANDQETISYAVTYTATDSLSISYGYEEIESGTANDEDAKYTSVSAAYTIGGVTLSARVSEGENIDHSANDAADVDYYTVGASFAF